MMIDTFPWGMRGRAPAKLNLTLEVLSRRTDGYHEIESLMVPINLYDTIYFRPNQSGQIDFTCSWELAAKRSVADDLPLDSGNLVIQALEAVRSKMDSQPGAVVHLTKRIPTESGMGGGSSDAACALVLANCSWQAGLTAAQLLVLAADIGSDVPFFLADQAAICRGRGELVTPIATQPGLPLVVVRPPVGFGTPAIYQAVEISAARCAAEPLARCLRQRDYGELKKFLNNDLEKPAADQSRWVETMRRDMADCGAVAHQMTGSGSAYFGICRHRRHQRIVAERLRHRGYEHVYRLESCCQ